MPFSIVNGAPPNQTQPLDSRGRFTAPWYAYLVSLQKANSGVTVGLGGLDLNGQTITGSANFTGPINFGVAPTFTDAAGTRTNLGLGSAATQPISAFDAAGAAAAVVTSSLQKSANLSDVANAATARTNLGLGTAAVANLASMPALTFAGTVNLGAQAFTGATLGNFTVGRAATFASAAVIWELNVLNSAGSDNVSLGQSSATYGSGGGLIAWIGNSNAFLYFTSTQDFRIGSGIGANPIATFKGAGRLLIGTTTDDTVSLLQVAGATLVKGPSLTVTNNFTAGAAGYLQVLSAPVSPYSGRLTFGTDGTGWLFAITKNQGGTLTDVLKAKDDLSVTVAGALFAGSIGATSLSGTLNLNGQALSGNTTGSITVGRAATFASAAVLWSINVLDSGAGDNVSLGQSSATYATGTIQWIGNSNAYLYFNSGHDLRIGSGISTIPIMTFKGSATLGRVLLGTLTDDGSTLLQVAGAAKFSAAVTFSAPDTLAFGAGWINWTPAVTASGSMTITALTINDAQYIRLGPFIHFKVYVSITLGGTAGNMLTFALPVTSVGQTSVGVVSIYDPTAAVWSPGFLMIDTTANLFRAYRASQANYSLGNGFLLLQGSYRVT